MGKNIWFYTALNVKCMHVNVKFHSKNVLFQKWNVYLSNITLQNPWIDFVSNGKLLHQLKTFNRYFHPTQSDDVSRVSRASKIVERMVNQNTFDDVAQGKLQF